MIDRRMFLSLTGASIATTSLVSCSGTEKRFADGVPHSPFDEYSTAAEVTAGVDLNGKLAVVTGCTSGIGFETMRVLALRGAWVVGTSRSLARAKAACAKVQGLPVVNASLSMVLKSILRLTTWVIRCLLTDCSVVCTCPGRDEL